MRSITTSPALTPGAIGDAERGLVLQPGSRCRFEKPAYLLEREHSRQWPWVAHAGKTPSELRPIESCAKEEAYRRSRTIELRRFSVMCTWKRRTSSAIAVSGERPRNLASSAMWRI